MIIYVTYNKDSQTFTRCQSDDENPSIAEVLPSSIQEDQHNLSFKISLNTSALEEEFLQGNDLPGVDIN